MEYVIWIALICCSVANGLIYSHEFLSYRYLYMAGVSLISVMLIILYYRYTKSWCRSEDEIQCVHYYEYHESVFIRSFMLTILMVIIALFCFPGGVLVGLITAGICFLICSFREVKYVWKYGPNYIYGPFFN